MIRYEFHRDRRVVHVRQKFSRDIDELQRPPSEPAMQLHGRELNPIKLTNRVRSSGHFQVSVYWQGEKLTPVCGPLIRAFTDGGARPTSKAHRQFTDRSPVGVGSRHRVSATAPAIASAQRISVHLRGRERSDGPVWCNAELSGCRNIALNCHPRQEGQLQHQRADVNTTARRPNRRRKRY
jgi:hypothetical protein